MTRRVDDAGTLFSYAASKPEGFTRYDVQEELGWRSQRFRKAVRELRTIFATDEINLICDPQGQGEAWMYQLVGTFEGASPWVTNRADDMETRLVTMLSVATSLVNASDGRTVEGRRARILQRHFQRAIEDLADLKVAA